MRKMDNLIRYTNKSPSEVLQMIGLTEPPFDPFHIASLIGLKVDETARFDSEYIGISGEISLDEKRIPVAWINPLDPSNRRRFTMAHELGHLVNDVLPHISEEGVSDEFRDGECNLRRDGRQAPEEYAANEFAASLLMPKEHVAKQGQRILAQYRESNGAQAKMPVSDFVTMMASSFEVSMQAMEIRLKRIGVL